MLEWQRRILLNIVIFTCKEKIDKQCLIDYGIINIIINYCYQPHVDNFTMDFTISFVEQPKSTMFGCKNHFIKCYNHPKYVCQQSTGLELWAKP